MSLETSGHPSFGGLVGINQEWLVLVKVKVNDWQQEWENCAK